MKMHHISSLLGFALLLSLLSSCGGKLPTTFNQSSSLPPIYPDYADVTVPVNIAPLTFQMDASGIPMAVRFTAGQHEVVCCGTKACPSRREWSSLIAEATGSAIQVEVYAQHQGEWTKYQPFSIHVSPDSIDPYISYRLIAPSYENYEELTINQRCLENYDERIVYNNMLCSEEQAGQCINCHNYQMYNPRRMQFHARQNHGGTVVAYDGSVRKVNMQSDSLLSSGVYPAWHPWLPLIVYSSNLTHQTFHLTDPNKVEVFDTESNLIAFDESRLEVTTVERQPNELEVFPCWSPDGLALYYCSAHFQYRDSVDAAGQPVDFGREMIARAYEVKYQLYKKSFDPSTMQFGPRELVFDAASINQSATLPRVSPDGRYLMFTLASYGVFHIWHKDADLWMLNLLTGEARAMSELNSADTESYHSWSSNSRWVVFSSRRNDGHFTRPFIAHIDKSGKASKPFELPCADPDYHRQMMKCYNIPEFMQGPVTITPQEFADVLLTEGEPVKYVSSLRK